MVVFYVEIMMLSPEIIWKGINLGRFDEYFDHIFIM